MQSRFSIFSQNVKKFLFFLLVLIHVNLNLSDLLFVFNHIEPIWLNNKFKSFESTVGGKFKSPKTPKIYQ